MHKVFAMNVVTYGQRRCIKSQHRFGMGKRIRNAGGYLWLWVDCYSGMRFYSQQSRGRGKSLGNWLRHKKNKTDTRSQMDDTIVLECTQFSSLLIDRDITALRNIFDF